jgi:hypothetical protein
MALTVAVELTLNDLSYPVEEAVGVEPSVV